MKNCKIHETSIREHFDPYILILFQFFEALSSLMHLKCSVFYTCSKTLRGASVSVSVFFYGEQSGASEWVVQENKRADKQVPPNATRRVFI